MSGKSEIKNIPPEEMEELMERFKQIDVNGSGKLDADELREAFKIVGFKFVNYQIHNLIKQYDVTEKDGKIDFSEFKKMYIELKKHEMGTIFTGSIQKRSGIEEHQGASGVHNVRVAEQEAFADWLNKTLLKDADCKKYLPFEKKGTDLYKKCSDGVIICKIINVSKPDTIDERVINKGDLNVFQKRENCVLAINSAKSIGIVVEGNRPECILEETKHLVLGLLWQIIKLGLLANITLQNHKDLVCLLRDGETIDDLMRMSPSDLLIRWVNYHLENAGISKRIGNFSADIKDSEAYAYLLQQISPEDYKRQMHPAKKVLSEPDTLSRAERVLENADKLNARVFVTAGDIDNGNANLNLAFVANLFNTYPALKKSNVEIEEEQIIEETREEKTFRNWINSLGVKPTVNNIYYDLRDGIVIFQLFDIVQPGCVDWKRVHIKFTKLRKNFEILENCNYAVELGKVCHFSLVGIGGEDLRDGNRTLTLALVWQLMRAYTLSLLKQCGSLGGSGDKPDVNDKNILSWAQNKLVGGDKKCKINSFQDLNLGDGLSLIDLVDAVTPGCINYSLVKRPATTPEDRLSNAKYAISVARRSGAMVYALPEDITEIKPKMILTMVASLMVLDHQKLAGSVGGPRAAESTTVN